MKKTVYLIFILAIFANCKKETKTPNIEDIEKAVRADQDYRAVFYYSDYYNMLETIKEKKCIVLPLNKMRNYFDSTKVILGLRHDIDTHLFKAIEMAKIEKEFNYKASYYILPTARYYYHTHTSVMVGKKIK